MKRDPRLHGLSSEHHHALVLARHAGELTPGELARRFDAELEPHFRVEEEILIPALRAAGATGLVARVEADHAALRASARSGDAHAFAEQLTLHVRFEERELFPACEERLPAAVLDEVARRAPHP